MGLPAALLLVTVATALLMLPGAAICLAAGTRWRDALAAGPALTLAVVAAGATVTAATDLRWGPASAGVTALAAVAGSAALGMAVRATGRRAWVRTQEDDDDNDPARRGPGPGVVDLVVVGLAVLPALQVLVATGGLRAIPQGWDAIVHGGATRYIAETGRAGVTDLGPLFPPPGIPPMTPLGQPPNTDSPVVDAIPPGPGTSLDGATGS